MLHWMGIATTIKAFVSIPPGFRSRFHILRASTRAKLFSIIPPDTINSFLLCRKKSSSFYYNASICNSKMPRQYNTYLRLLLKLRQSKQFQRYWGIENAILQHLNSAKWALIKYVWSISQFLNKIMSMLESSQQYSSQICVTSTIAERQWSQLIWTDLIIQIDPNEPSINIIYYIAFNMF